MAILATYKINFWQFTVWQLSILAILATFNFDNFQFGCF